MKLIQFCGALLGIAMVVMSSQSIAAVYKCIDGSGKVNYQESPCRSGSAGSEIPIQGASAGLSPEDQAWVTERKPTVRSMCMQNLNTIAGQYFTPDEGEKICECGVNRYFSNPIAKLRDLENRRDIEGNKKLFRPAMTGCAKEVIDNRP